MKMIESIILEPWEDICGILKSYSLRNQKLTLDVFGEMYSVSIGEKFVVGNGGVLDESTIGHWIRILRTDIPNKPFFVGVIN